MFFNLLLVFLGPFTLLLPNNAAIEALGSDLLDELLEDDNFNILQDLLLYHILPGATPSNEFKAGTTETLFSPADVIVSLEPIMFNSADVLEPNVAGCNGIFHVIDEVLTPGTSK